MTVDDGVRALEIELAELAADLTAVGWHECVLCYVNRMVVAHGCDGTLRWLRRWRQSSAPRATRLERRAGQVGAYCDCELFLNGWDVTVDIVRDESTGDEYWPDTVTGCRGVPAGVTQPCSLWERLNGATRW
ncbi:DUF2695 domain-containing protein [Georgenia deserti]|uniref:DUF2695 domain-containing protein n=1 Tax=Georgenia deserti TaxID=2093781 RepID=A0ABW4L634_9MICO